MKEWFVRSGFLVVSILSSTDCEEEFSGFVWVVLVGWFWCWKVLKRSWKEMVRIRKQKFDGWRGEQIVEFCKQWRRAEISLPERKRVVMMASSLNCPKLWAKSPCFWLPETRNSCESGMDLGAGNAAAGKILLVEDTEINRMLLRKLFTGLNLLLEEAENGQIAVDFFKQGKTYDLVLMDKEMPVMDGHEATRQLRLLGVKTPIVALTGNSLQSDKDMFFQAGANEFQTKPLSKDELVRLLARYGL